MIHPLKVCHWQILRPGQMLDLEAVPFVGTSGEHLREQVAGTKDFSANAEADLNLNNHRGQVGFSGDWDNLFIHKYAV